MGHKGVGGYRALLSRVIGGTYALSKGFNGNNTLFIACIQLSGARNTLERVISVPSAHRRVLRVLGFNLAKISKII
jgi:hypothetical protein